MGILPTMASVVRHRSGSWEIRESANTPLGPRSRTLATFRVLTPDVLARVSERASADFDAAAIRRAARRKGAPVAPEPQRDAALTMLRELQAGQPLAPGLRQLLRAALADGPAATETDAVSPQAEAVLPWAQATAAERGAALVDLLLLADALPAQPPRAERFPRLCSRPEPADLAPAA